MSQEKIKLDERATIMFPRELPDSERKTFCNYIARHIPQSEIEMRWHQTESYGDLYNKVLDQIPCDIRKERVNGTLKSLTSSLDFTMFRQNEFDDRGSHIGLKIDTALCDRYEEIPEHRRKLMKEFTKVVNDYFLPKE